jgi:hypothetical protein
LLKQKENLNFLLVKSIVAGAAVEIADLCVISSYAAFVSASWQITVICQELENPAGNLEILSLI